MASTKKLSTFRRLSEYQNSAEPVMVAQNFKLPLEVMEKIREIQKAAASPHMGTPSVPEVITGIFLEVAPNVINDYIKDLIALKERQAQEQAAAAE